MAKRRRRKKCGFNKKNPRGAQKGRTAGGKIKPGYRLTKAGRVRKARKK